MTTKKDIESALMRGADTLRDTIDAANYKDYVLPVMFVKYLSDSYTDAVEELSKQYSGIRLERQKMDFLRKRADYIIDTSHLLTRELRQEIEKIFVNNEKFCNMMVTVLSFGFKYGIPSDADLVFDVRFLPNPFYVDELKPLTGDDKPVYDYVMSSPKAVEFRNKMKDMLDFLIPNYIAEGKTQLVIAIGCTGGKHRSVTLTNAMYEEYANTEYGCKKEHRDIEKDRLRYICRSQEK